MNALIVVNPTAGEGVPSPEDVAACCRAAGADIRMEITTCPGEALAWVASATSGASPPDVVVAVGGDGTVREVAEGLARGLGRWPGGTNVTVTSAATALLVIPAGSGNSAYRAVWGERDWHETVTAAFDGSAHRVRALDLIRLVELDRSSVLGVNAGLVAAIASRIERDKEGHRGQRVESAGDHMESTGGTDDERYWSALARALGEFQPTRLRVTLDGSVLHEGGAMLVSVGGVRSFGRGAFRLLPRSLLDDALLDVCIAAEVTSERLTELAALVPTGAHVKEREVTYERGRVVRMECLQDADLEIEHDGDPLRAPRTLTLEVLPAAVPILAPTESPETKEESLWSS
jgi:diacylglycerol kinase (ATP)